MRLDLYLQEKFNLKSRTYSQNLIKTNCVKINNIIVNKPSIDVNDSDVIEIIEDNNYSSQGAFKIEEAIKVFNINVNGLTTADIGCSNGGFTDSLIRHGAKEVFAIDVGECCLDQKLLDDNRVHFINANARELSNYINNIDFLCSDVSFISLKLVMGEFYKVLKDNATCVLLIKPQFELDKKSLTKSGIVKNDKLREKVVNDIKAFAESLQFKILGLTQSPVRYENKNIEYLIYLQK